jgi:hypothetical protein
LLVTMYDAVRCWYYQKYALRTMNEHVYTHLSDVVYVFIASESESITHLVNTASAFLFLFLAQIGRRARPPYAFRFECVIVGSLFGDSDLCMSRFFGVLCSQFSVVTGMYFLLVYSCNLRKLFCVLRGTI